MQASRSGDPWLYINTHVRVLSGGFLQFLDFSVCLRAAGEQALWLCPRRGVCSSVSLQRWEGAAALGQPGAWGSEGLQGAVQSKEPPPTAAGKETAGSWTEGGRLSLPLFSLLCLLSLTPSCFSLSHFPSSLLSFPHSPSHSIHHTTSPSQQLH